MSSSQKNVFVFGELQRRNPYLLLSLKMDRHVRERFLSKKGVEDSLCCCLKNVERLRK